MTNNEVYNIATNVTLQGYNLAIHFCELNNYCLAGI
jgi:hypothetical protein